VEIDEVPADEHVDLRFGEPGRPDQGKELALQLRAGPWGGADQLRECGSEPGGGPTGGAVEEVLQRRDVQSLEPIGGLESSAEFLRVRRLGVVEQGARRAGDWDRVEDGPVLRVQGVDAVQANAGLAAPPGPGNRDVNRPARRGRISQSASAAS
jgi:hypothetical protein